LGFLADEFNVHDGVVCAFVLGELEIAFCFYRGSNELLAQQRIIIARIKPVLSSNPYSMITENVPSAGFSYTGI
jgi:hypothetical protein